MLLRALNAAAAESDFVSDRSFKQHVTKTFKDGLSKDMLRPTVRKEIQLGIGLFYLKLQTFCLMIKLLVNIRRVTIAQLKELL